MRTSDIPFSFTSSPEVEKERLLYTTTTVASGFYPKHGFLITKNPIKKYERFSIVLPEVIKNVSPEFWKDAEYGGNFMPKILSKKMWRETKKLVLPTTSKMVILEFEKKWNKIKEQALIAVNRIFPQEMKWIKSIEVRITKIGSYSSHYLLQKKRGQHLILNIREDATYLEIINLIILSLIYPQAEELGLSFTHRQTVRNFILSRPDFKKLYPNYKYRSFDNSKIPISLRRKSEEYIKYLGIPNIIDPVSVIHENMSIFGVRESKLIKEIINKRGQILTYDDIADLIWGEGKFKSYWAINKMVQRIQKKLDKININFKIKGVRGIGYMAK